MRLLCKLGIHKFEDDPLIPWIKYCKYCNISTIDIRYDTTNALIEKEYEHPERIKLTRYILENNKFEHYFYVNKEDTRYDEEKDSYYLDDAHIYLDNDSKYPYMKVSGYYVIPKEELCQE